MAMRLRLFSNFLLLAVSSGACSPSFDADLPEVEVTQRGVKVPAAPATMAGGDVAVSGTFTLSSSDAAWAKRMNTEVQIHQVTIAPGGTLSSLDFIEFALVNVSGGSNPESPTKILDYDRAIDAPAGSAIDVDMPAPIDITTAWIAGNTVIDFQVAGQLPTQDWTVDVSLKLSGKIAYKY
jgi:hypothetical protein